MSAFDQTYWNTGQVLAWVFLGDRRLVEDLADHADTLPQSYWAEQRVPPNGKTELVMLTADPPDALTLEIRAAQNRGAAFGTLDDAKRAVLNELRSGRLRAIGLRNDEGDLIEVPATDWLGMDLHWRERNFQFDAGPRPLRPRASCWYRLQFKREEVLAIWPDQLATALTGMETALLAVEASTEQSGDKIDDSAAPAQVNVRRRGRKPTPDQDRCELANLERVLSEANKLVEAQGKKSIRGLARLLANPDITRIPRPEPLPFKEATIRDILSGRYEAMRRLGIESPFATGSGER